MDNGAPQMALIAGPMAPLQQVDGALRAVTFNRNPPVEGAKQAGIGIAFGRHMAQASGFLFDVLDRDRDGIITREEYNAGFDTMDINKNGKLSRTEFNFDSYFSALDKDGDEQLSRAEYEAGFDSIDTDNDGKICRLEFVAAAGPYKIHTISPAGTASQSGLIHVGDLLFEVNEVSVLGLTAGQVTALILGDPSSPITMTISTPQMSLLAAATGQAQDEMAAIESKAQQGVEAVSEIQVKANALGVDKTEAATQEPGKAAGKQVDACGDLADAVKDLAEEQAQKGAEAPKVVSETVALVESSTPEPVIRAAALQAGSKSRWEPTWQENFAAWNKQRSKK